MDRTVWKHCWLAPILAAPLMWSVAAANAAEKVTVAVTAIVEHPALDAVRDGLLEKLKKAGYGSDRLNFVYESAQGQPSIAAQIARKLAGDAPDVIVAISTPSAQAAASATKEIPIVFSAVTDPVAAGLLKAFKAGGSNVTGISDLSPVADQLSLFKEIMPRLARLGAPYNPGESNSVAAIKQLKEVAGKVGIEIITSAANRTGDVKNAVQNLVGKVDAVYVLPDNTITSALDTVVQVTRTSKLPLFSNDLGSVEKGAIASVGFSYFEIGEETGDMVLKILDGAKPGDIDPQYASGTEIVVNRAAASDYGISIPQSVIAKAGKVIE